jgi:hypothetical protein
MSRPLYLVVLTAAMAVSLAACSGSTAGLGTVAPSATAAPTSAASSGGASGSADPSAAVTRVSANTATSEELVAALTAAGVPNADRWAREIEEYRPYDSSDPTLARLQSNLAKYDPDPATLAAILSALEP